MDYDKFMRYHKAIAELVNQDPAIWQKVWMVWQKWPSDRRERYIDFIESASKRGVPVAVSITTEIIKQRIES